MEAEMKEKMKVKTKAKASKMKMNWHPATLLALILLAALLGCQGNKGGPGGSSMAEPKSEDDKTLYATGSMFGSKLKELQLNEHEVSMIIAGVYDGALGKKLKVDMATQGPKVQEFFRKRMSAKSDTEKKKGVEYLENFIKKEGAKKTDSGLAYKIIQPGTGPFPKKTDVVEVHYTGKLMDGTVFDSSGSGANR